MEKRKNKSKYSKNYVKNQSKRGKTVKCCLLVPRFYFLTRDIWFFVRFYYKATAFLAFSSFWLRGSVFISTFRVLCAFSLSTFFVFGVQLIVWRSVRSFDGMRLFYTSCGL